MYSQHPYKKMGGFLLVWVIIGCLSIVSSAIQLTRLIWDSVTAINLAPEIIPYLLFAIPSQIAIIILFVVHLIQIYQRNPKFLLFFHITQILSLLVYAIILMWTASILYQRRIEADSTVVSEFFGSVIRYIAISVYFNRSVRVRTYMGTDSYFRMCPLTRNVIPPVPADMMYPYPLPYELYGQAPPAPPYPGTAPYGPYGQAPPPPVPGAGPYEPYGQAPPPPVPGTGPYEPYGQTPPSPPYPTQEQGVPQQPPPPVSQEYFSPDEPE